MDQGPRPVPQTIAMHSHAPQQQWPAPQAAPPKTSGPSLGLVLGLGCGGFGLLLMFVAAALGAYWMVGLEEDAPPPVAIEELAPPPVAMPVDPHAGERFRVPVLPTTPARGPADALVTIVEIGEFQCPYCARAAGTLTQLQSEYPGTIRVAWRHNPLPMHAQARDAAVLAAEAYAQGGDASFWRTHDALFANQSNLSAPTTLRSVAVQAGLDTAAWDRAAASRTHDATISADQALASQLGARGTPTFFINGRLLSGAQPIERFREIVREELTYAQSVRDAGVAPTAVYDRIVEHGRTSPAPEPAAAPTRPSRPDPEEVHRVPVLDSPRLGPDDALVTVVVFSDFQCPFCSRVVPTLTQLRQRYGADLRIVFKHNPLPFHQRAAPAARAAIEVHRERGDAAFFQMHDLLFENQRSLEDEDLVRYAAQVGASRTRVRAALAGEGHRDVIARDQALAAQLGARGTPSFFINGHVLTGAQPLTAFTQRVDTELAEARARVAAGVPRASVYEAVTAP